LAVLGVVKEGTASQDALFEADSFMMQPAPAGSLNNEGGASGSFADTAAFASDPNLFGGEQAFDQANKLFEGAQAGTVSKVT